MTGNLFDLSCLPSDTEQVFELVRGGACRIERIVSSGQSTGWYDQNETEFVALLTGRAAVEYEDGTRAELAAGDTLVIPPHCRHRVAGTSAEPPCVWLCVFF